MGENRYFTGVRLVEGVKTATSIPCWFSTGRYDSVEDFFADPDNSIDKFIKSTTATSIDDSELYLQKSESITGGYFYYVVSQDSSVFSPLDKVPSNLVWLNIKHGDSSFSTSGPAIGNTFIIRPEITGNLLFRCTAKGDHAGPKYNSPPIHYNVVSYNTNTYRIALLVQYPPRTTTSGVDNKYEVLDSITLSNLDRFTDDNRYPNPTAPGTYEPGGLSGPAGGGGGFGNDRENDDITELIPPGSAANSLTDAGIFSHYLVNSAQLKDFSRWLFSDNFLEVLSKELIELWWGDTFGAIISLMSYPFAVGKLPMITSKPSNIYLGHFDTKAGSSGLLTSESSQLDWGNIDITEYWGNFLDYAPHTKIQLYLPWGTGFVDIDPNECMNGSLNVKTNIELAKGNCVHIVSNSSGSVIGTYNGFCGAQYPITSKDTSGKAIGTVISAVSAAVAIGSAAVTGGASIAGNAAATAANAAAELGLSGTVGKEFKAEAEAAFAKADKFRKVTSTAAKTAAVSSIAAARTPVNYVRSGSFSPNAGHLAVQVPYIIMTWPDQSVPEQYGNFVGYPSNIFARLGSLNGYTEVGAIHLDYINCTEHEREEVLRILQGGVIL